MHIMRSISGHLLLHFLCNINKLKIFLTDIGQYLKMTDFWVQLSQTAQVQIAPNGIDPPSFFHDLKGYYPCRRCSVCLHNICGRRKSELFESTTTSRRYQIKHFTTCATRHIVYLLTCPCKKKYVGRTIRSFSVRVNKHLASIKKGRTNHSVPRHYLHHNNKNPSGTQFQIIDKFVPH